MISKAKKNEPPEDAFMRLEIKVSPKVIEAVARLADGAQVPVGRMAAKLLAKALKIPEAEALPPFRPAGRPSRAATPGN